MAELQREVKGPSMSASVLASIIQNCKARNKCFTSSPQDATPVQGLHFRVQGWGAVEESVKGFPAFPRIEGKY